MFIDTHTHLQFDSYDEDRETVIQRAIKNNIDAMITIGTDVASSEQVVEMAQRFAVVFAAVGIHPNDSMDVDNEDFDKIKHLATQKKVVAIGEIGVQTENPAFTHSKLGACAVAKTVAHLVVPNIAADIVVEVAQAVAQ